ncbi:MAG: hypothetical protein HQM09_01290 [Candidatus Riflebacteria bacterium]|nr:hypothetical protein [Candidatus Riflebacteria bacterium]
MSGRFSTRRTFAIIFFITMDFLLRLFAPYSAQAGVASSAVDFERQVVSVWGIGGQPWEESSSYEEERARAWMDALHHAYEETLGIPLSEGLDVRNALHQYPTLRPHMSRILLAAPRTFFEEDESKLIRCRVELPFTGPAGLRSALFLAALHPHGSEPRVFVGTDSAIATESRLIDPADTLGVTVSHTITGSASPVLRVVIDLRETFFEPSLFPRFFDDEGRLIYQEGRISSSERFSRPVVRFSQDIADAVKGLKDDQLLYASGRTPLLSRRDVVIRTPDDDFIRRFCRRLDTEPFWKGEILIIHGNRVIPPGAIVKSSARDGSKKSDGASTSGEPTKPAATGRTRRK